MWIDQENKAKEERLALQDIQYYLAENACQARNVQYMLGTHTSSIKPL